MEALLSPLALLPRKWTASPSTLRARESGWFESGSDTDLCLLPSPAPFIPIHDILLPFPLSNPSPTPPTRGDSSTSTLALSNNMPRRGELSAAEVDAFLKTNDYLYAEDGEGGNPEEELQCPIVSRAVGALAQGEPGALTSSHIAVLACLQGPC